MDTRSQISQQEAYDLVVDCLQDHQKINRLADIIQMTFSTLLDIQLTINTLSVVIAAFRLTKSTDIGKAAYEVDWINGSEKVRSAVKMITIRTQKPLKLTALRGLVMFDLETLVDIMRLSYTCFTVVKSLDT
uniref:Odorant receptor 28 n=1 Tax=Subpsaltria yangi TaxID=1195109 RepID=A0A385IUU6_9HEMI|nr:odorant receptor 28 [Subpsaltria yangi]